MLVLTRKTNQRFFIGKDIVITLVETDRGRCRIGIEAPRGVTVVREELLTAAEIETIVANSIEGSGGK